MVIISGVPIFRIFTVKFNPNPVDGVISVRRCNTVSVMQGIIVSCFSATRVKMKLKWLKAVDWISCRNEILVWMDQSLTNIV